MWDTILKLLQDHTIMSLAFLAWAYVVWHYGRKISDELEVLTESTNKMNYILSNRITKVEAHMEHMDDSFKPYRNGN